MATVPVALIYVVLEITLWSLEVLLLRKARQGCILHCSRITSILDIPLITVCAK